MKNNNLYPEIPLDAGQVTGWKNIPIIEDDHPDPLVPLGPFSKEANILTTSSIYFGEHSNSPYAKKINSLEGSLLTLFARRSVAHRLLIAENLLPTDYHLIVFDAYRPYKVQESLYDFYKQKLREKYPKLPGRQLDSITQKYVSLPSTDAARPSPHNTGGAIDAAIIKLDPLHEEELRQVRLQLASAKLTTTKRADLETRLSTIVRHNGKMLNFGTAFDHGGEKSALTYYESRLAAGETLTNNDLQACNNRRLLFEVMTQTGLQAYFAEWWHFNAPESQMGAATASLQQATMGAARLEKREIAHENKRLRIYQKMSDSRIANDWPTEIIAPPKE
jgi:D-alanyl-D-alanine dipeptidase